MLSAPVADFVLHTRLRPAQVKPKDVFVNQELDFGSIEWVRRSALRCDDDDCAPP
jgi:hypothetical protein